MNPVFAVFKQGVYRHEIVGIFLTEGEARSAAEAAAKAEPDDYHSFDVLMCEIGIPESDNWRIATLKRKDQLKFEKFVKGRAVWTIVGTDLNWKEVSNG